MHELIVTAVYLVGFFSVFRISTRDGDTFLEVMMLSLLWPFIAFLLSLSALFEGFHWLYVKIEGDA